ncbi:hypothetical protein WN943_000969 [Citrus x changshan-huyou]
MEKAWQYIQLKKHTMISNSKDVLVAELGRQSLKLPLCWRVSRVYGCLAVIVLIVVVVDLQLILITHAIL